MAMKLLQINLFDSIKTNRLAEVNHCLKTGSSPNARCKGYPGLPDGWSPLHEAAHRDPLITKILIKHGANCNLSAGTAGTPLHLTSQLEIARILIESGADLAVKNAKGETPLAAQRQLGHAEIVELLIQKGAKD